MAIQIYLLTYSKQTVIKKDPLLPSNNANLSWCSIDILAFFSLLLYIEFCLVLLTIIFDVLEELLGKNYQTPIYWQLSNYRQNYRYRSKTSSNYRQNYWYKNWQENYRESIVIGKNYLTSTPAYMLMTLSQHSKVVHPWTKLYYNFLCTHDTYLILSDYRDSTKFSNDARAV